jgi:hypothetical protein
LEDKEKEVEALKEAQNTKREVQEMKDKFDSIKQSFGRMTDAWEIMAQRWEENNRNGDKESSSSSSPRLQLADAIEKIISTHSQQEAEKVRVKKRASSLKDMVCEDSFNPFLSYYYVAIFFILYLQM